MPERGEEPHDQAAHWAKRVRDCWHKSVIAVIETGNTLIEARRRVNRGEWGYMFRIKGHPDRVPEPIPFGQSTGDKLMDIARRFTESEFIPNLPAEWSVLNELVGVDDTRLRAAIEKGEINSETTVVQAKRFKEGKPPLAKPEWSTAEVMEETRRFASRMLRDSPKGNEMAIGHALQAVAYEILTPLPKLAVDRLNEALANLNAWDEADAEEALAILNDPPRLMGWIASNGGLKLGPDHPARDLPPTVRVRALSKTGRGLDELAAIYASEFGGREGDIERRMIRTLERPDRRPSKAASKAEIKSMHARMRRIEDSLSGRVLKTGWVNNVFPLLGKVVADEELLPIGYDAEGGIFVFQLVDSEFGDALRRDAQKISERMEPEERAALDRANSEWIDGLLTERVDTGMSRTQQPKEGRTPKSRPKGLGLA